MSGELRGEDWAIERLQLGQAIAFPEDWAVADRSVSGQFVIDAILDPQWAKTPAGFHLANAVILTPLDRRYAQVDGELCFENCVFEAGAALPYAYCKRRVRFLGCTFKQDLNMQASRVSDLEFGRATTGETTTFHGEANFFSLEVSGQLFCNHTQYLNKDATVNFNSAKIAGNAYFQGALFHGPADFGHAEIGRNLVCREAQFLSDQGEAVFNSLKVLGNAFFDKAMFRGPVDLGDSTFSRNLSLIGARFEKFLNFSNTSVAGTLYLYSMSGSRGHVTTFETQLPPAADLRGLTYDRTDLEYDNRWQTWLTLRRHPDSFDPAPFLTLESYLHETGRDDLADRVHYEMRKAEGDAYWRQGRMDKWALNSLLRWTVGYGVYGWRLFVWAGAVFVPAWLFFVVSLKMAIEPDKPVSLWSLIYTMDVFLPVSLNQEELYSRPGPAFAIVKFVTKLWGWVIVPLAMAQLAGFLKKKR